MGMKQKDIFYTRQQVTLLSQFIAYQLLGAEAKSGLLSRMFGGERRGKRNYRRGEPETVKQLVATSEHGSNSSNGSAWYSSSLLVGVMAAAIAIAAAVAAAVLVVTARRRAAQMKIETSEAIRTSVASTSMPAEVPTPF